MPYYKPCGHEVAEVIDRMKEKYHGDLKDHGVTVDALFAYGTVTKRGIKKPALKHGGYPALATIKIVNLKDRTAGMGDAQLLIDGDRWASLGESEKDALVDHELTHLEVARHRKTGEVKTDDLDRPILKMRKHDHQFGWFTSVARRHAGASQEVQQATAFFEGNRQTYLPFMETAEAA